MKTSEWNTLLKEQHDRAFAVAQAFTPAQAEEIVRNGQNAAEEFRRKSEFWAGSEMPAGFGCNPSPEAQAVIDDLIVGIIRDGLAQILESARATPALLAKAEFVRKFEALKAQILNNCATISDPLVCVRSIRQLFNDFGKQSIPARKDTYAVQNPVDFGKTASIEQKYQLKVRVVERRVGADLHFEYAAPGHKSARYSVQQVPGVRVGDRVRVCVNDSLGQTVFITTAPGVFVECVPRVVNQYGFFVDAPIRRNDPMAEPIKEGEPIIPKEVMDVLRRYGITVGSVSAVSGS